MDTLSSIHWIYMYHNVFYTGKALLYGVMHMLCNLVRIPKRCIAVRADLNIHIDAVAKNPCAQKIHAKHALLFQRTVNHLINSILKNIIRCLLNKKTNTQAGNSVTNRIAKPCPRNTDQRADG